MADPRVEKLTFTCRPEDFGVIAPPVPAKTILPDWFRRLPAIDVRQEDGGFTVKRCMPVLDAFCLGWIIPLAATVQLEVSGDGAAVSGDRLIAVHKPYQIAGHHHQPRLTAKFLNPWTIRTPPGWSCLFVPPLNRDGIFECMSAVVDTDTFRAKPVNFPFFVTACDGSYTLEAGTPLVQVIPFQRETLTANIRPSTAEEDRLDAEQRVLFDVPSAGYRKFVRAKR